MSRREDILDGTELGVWTRRFGLVYTCNAGWLDLGHLNPESTRPEIGAANLWRQVAAEGAAMLDPRCAPPPPLGGLLGAAHHALVKPDTCETVPLYRISGGATGYPVRYRQDSGSLPGRPGKEGRFVIKRGLSLSEKRSVALAIFVEISLKFENLQVFAKWLGIGQSFTPKLAQRTGNEVRGLCQDERRLQPRKLPRVFTTIRPAIKGILFRDLPAF